MVRRLDGFGLLDRRSDASQPTGERHDLIVRRTGEQAVMPDPVEATRQDVGQEAADKLVGRQRHDLLAFGPVATVILLTERHAGIVEGDQPPV
jgi:hypothetical protein